jgi:hypothetical protein
MVVPWKDTGIKEHEDQQGTFSQAFLLRVLEKIVIRPLRMGWFVCWWVQNTSVRQFDLYPTL